MAYRSIEGFDRNVFLPFSVSGIVFHNPMTSLRSTHSDSFNSFIQKKINSAVRTVIFKTNKKMQILADEIRKKDVTIETLNRSISHEQQKLRELQQYYEQKDIQRQQFAIESRETVKQNQVIRDCEKKEKEQSEQEQREQEQRDRAKRGREQKIRERREREQSELAQWAREQQDREQRIREKRDMKQRESEKLDREHREQEQRDKEQREQEQREQEQREREKREFEQRELELKLENDERIRVERLKQDREFKDKRKRQAQQRTDKKMKRLHQEWEREQREQACRRGSIPQEENSSNTSYNVLK